MVVFCVAVYHTRSGKVLATAFAFGRVFVGLSAGTDPVSGPFGGQVRNSVPQPPPSFFSQSLNFHVHLSPGGSVDLRIHQAIAQFIFSTGTGGSIPHPPWRIVNVPIVDHVAQLEVRFPEIVVVCIQHFLDLAGRHEMEFEGDQALSGARLVLTAA